MPSKELPVDNGGPPPSPLPDISANDCVRYANNYTAKKMSEVKDSEQIVIFFPNAATPGANASLSQAGFASVNVTIDGNTYPVPAAASWNKNWNYFAFKLEDIGTLPMASLKHGELVKIDLGTTGVSYSSLFVKYRKKWNPYGVGGSKTYAWFPVGLVSTDFRKTDDGIPLSAMPIGLAFGVKWSAGASGYVGGSIMANWLITPKSDAENKATGDYTLKAGTVGLLVDIANYAYVGGAYGMDFRSGAKDPGLMFVVGVAPGLLDVLSSRPL